MTRGTVLMAAAVAVTVTVTGPASGPTIAQPTTMPTDAGIWPDITADVISPDDRTRVLVLASAHLSMVGDKFAAEALDSLIEGLKRFRPDVVCVEAMPPSVIAAMEARPAVYGQVVQQLARERTEVGQQARKSLGLTRDEAMIESGRVVSRLRDAGDDAERRTLRARLVMLFLAADEIWSAVLQWSVLASTPGSAGEVPPDGILTFLDARLRDKNEIVTVGLRVAREVGLERIGHIDDHLDTDVFLQIAAPLSAELAAHPLVKAAAESPLYRDSQARLLEACERGDLLPYYRFINSDDYLRPDVATQWLLFLKTRLPSGNDRARLALWEVRNLNIASHIRRESALRPGGRVLVIIGASHKPFLDAYLSRLMDVQVVQLAELVGR